MYIYELPPSVFKECSNILDENYLWEKLGLDHMNFDKGTIQSIKRHMMIGNSPTEKLLLLWGNKNHTVLELFSLLKVMENYESMNILKDYVDPQYHYLIKDGAKCSTHRTNINNKIKQNNKNDSEKILNVDLKKTNYNTEMSKENNESEVNDGDFPKTNKTPPYLGFNLAGKTSKMSVSNISCVFESGSIPQVSYEDLEKSTNNWDTKTILGKGGFGTVFKGTWKRTEVAIKRIENKKNNPDSYNEQFKQSITELYCLNSYRHDNVLPLYGFSINGPQPCLVYQYMPGGCLEHRLRVQDITKVLNWPTRLSIAIGTARGLQYLHTIGDKPLIHGDIKSANILLDTSNSPKIGDFGLAREGPHANYTHIEVSRIHGTRPYLPNEFLRGKKFSTKVDTYSFGVVLFEIATALSAYSDRRDEKFLRDFVVNYQGDILDLKDKRIENGENYFKRLIDIGRLCASEKPKGRPEMVQVLIDLEKPL